MKTLMHVSVYAYASCKERMMTTCFAWPFTGEVTITILYQLADQKHFRCIVSFLQDDEAGRRVVNERTSRGYGFTTIHSFSTINLIHIWDCQYLKDDCLYFQIEVTPPKPVKPWLACTTAWNHHRLNKSTIGPM